MKYNISIVEDTSANQRSKAESRKSFIVGLNKAQKESMMPSLNSSPMIDTSAELLAGRTAKKIINPDKLVKEEPFKKGQKNV